MASARDAFEQSEQTQEAESDEHHRQSEAPASDSFYNQKPPMARRLSLSSQVPLNDVSDIPGDVESHARSTRPPSIRFSESVNVMLLDPAPESPPIGEPHGASSDDWDVPAAASTSTTEPQDSMPEGNHRCDGQIQLSSLQPRQVFITMAHNCSALL